MIEYNRHVFIECATLSVLKMTTFAPSSKAPFSKNQNVQSSSGSMIFQREASTQKGDTNLLLGHNLKKIGPNAKTRDCLIQSRQIFTFERFLVASNKHLN